MENEDAKEISLWKSLQGTSQWKTMKLVKTIESKVETSFKGEDIGRKKTDVESRSEAAPLGSVLTDNSIAKSFGLGSHDGVCVCGICLLWEVWKWISCLKDRSCQV